MKPPDSARHVEHYLRSEDKRLDVVDHAIPFTGNVSELFEQICRNLETDSTYLKVERESNGPVRVGGAEWMEVRLRLQRAEDGALRLRQFRALSGLTQTILIWTEEPLEERVPTNTRRSPKESWHR